MQQSTHTPDGYPRLLRRLQAVFIDGFVIPLAALATLVALTYAGIQSTWIKVLVPLLVVFLLEPVAVSTTGGSVGHHLVGLRVRKDSGDERINLLAALVRFVVKTLFGLPSFFVAFVTEKRQALHDLAARSLIIHKSAVDIPAYELIRARTRDDEQAAYASVWRRIGVMLLYWVLLYAAASVVVAVVMSGPCISDAFACSRGQQIAVLAATPVLLVAFVVVAVLTWTGRLYGCRKHVYAKPGDS